MKRSPSSAGRNEPPTTRFKRILEKLTEFSFTLGYIKGGDLHLVDFLSRAIPQNDESPTDIIPISFMQVDPVMSMKELEACEGDSVHEYAFPSTQTGSRRVTRAYAKKHNIQVPSLHKTSSPSLKPVKQTNPPSRTTSNTSKSLPTNKPIKQGAVSGMVTRQKKGQGKIGKPVAKTTKVNTRDAGMRIPRGEKSQLLEVEERPTLIEPQSRMGTTPLQAQIPQKVDLEPVESHTSPTEDLFDEKQPLFKDIDEGSILSRRVPRQADIDKILHLIKS